MMIHQANDRKLATIHGLDHVYMETLIQYLRTALNKDPDAVEDVIADLLDGVITAITAGQSAKQHFSADPQQAADAILHELPNRHLRQYATALQPWVALLGALFFVSGLLRWPFRWTVDDLSFLVMPTVVLLAIWGARGMAFNRLSRRTQRNMSLGCLGIVAGYVGLFWLSAKLRENQKIPKWALAVAVILLAAWAIAAGCNGSGWYWLVTWGLCGACVLISTIAAPAWVHWPLTGVVLLSTVLAYGRDVKRLHAHQGGRS